jgi:hypothetical protein
MDIEILCDLICVFFVGYDGTTGDWGDDYSRYMSADGVDLTAVSIIFLMIVVFFFESSLWYNVFEFYPFS